MLPVYIYTYLPGEKIPHKVFFFGGGATFSLILV